MEYNITYRKKDKGWQYIISVKDNTGKWSQPASKQGFKLKEDAKNAAKEKVKELEEKFENQPVIDPKFEDITLGEFLELELERFNITKERNTARSLRSAIKRVESIHSIPLKDVTVLDFEKCFIDAYQKDGLKTSSLKQYEIFLKTALNKAVDKYKLINTNPIVGIDIPKDKKSKYKKIKVLPQGEFMKLVESIEDPEYRLMTVFAGGCGLRLGEILGLFRSDIIEKSNKVKVDKQWKLLKDDTFGIGSTKSSNSDREVPLSAWHLREIKNYYNSMPMNYDGRIFSFKNTDSASTLIGIVYRKLGFEISIHELRHTYATFLVSKGLDFRTIAKLMGHGVEMTIRTYSHVNSDMDQNAFDIIQEIYK